MAGEVTIASTTDPIAVVEATLDHDQAANYQESAPTGGHIHIASSTDDQAAVNEAAALYDTAAEEGFVTPIVQSQDKSVASTTDDQKSVDQAALDLQQEKNERPDYLTGRKSATRRISELVKQRGTLEDENARLRQQLAGENTRLREQLAGRTPPPETESSEQPQNDQEQQNDQTQPPQAPKCGQGGWARSALAASTSTSSARPPATRARTRSPGSASGTKSGPAATPSPDRKSVV